MREFLLYYSLPILIISGILFILAKSGIASKGYFGQAAIVLLVGILSSLVYLGLLGFLVGLPAIVLTALVSPVFLKRD